MFAFITCPAFGKAPHRIGLLAYNGDVSWAPRQPCVTPPPPAVSGATSEGGGGQGHTCSAVVWWHQVTQSEKTWALALATLPTRHMTAWNCHVPYFPHENRWVWARWKNFKVTAVLWRCLRSRGDGGGRAVKRAVCRHSNTAEAEEKICFIPAFFFSPYAMFWTRSPIGKTYFAPVLRNVTTSRRRPLPALRGSISVTHLVQHCIQGATVPRHITMVKQLEWGLKKTLKAESRCRAQLP